MRYAITASRGSDQRGACVASAALALDVLDDLAQADFTIDDIRDEEGHAVEAGDLLAASQETTHPADLEFA